MSKKLEKILLVHWSTTLGLVRSLFLQKFPLLQLTLFLQDQRWRLAEVNNRNYPLTELMQAVAKVGSLCSVGEGQLHVQATYPLHPEVHGEKVAEGVGESKAGCYQEIGKSSTK